MARTHGGCGAYNVTVFIVHDEAVVMVSDAADALYLVSRGKRAAS
jgi:hypothetical protein